MTLSLTGSVRDLAYSDPTELLSSPEEIRAKTHKISAKHGWGFTKAQIAALGEPPVSGGFANDGTIHVYVLVPRFSDVQTTFDQLSIAAHGQHRGGVLRSVHLKSDAHHLRATPGVTLDRPGLSWELLVIGRKSHLRHRGTPAGAAVLAMAYLHPKLIRGLHHHGIKHLLMPGYEAKHFDSEKIIEGTRNSASVPRPRMFGKLKGRPSPSKTSNSENWTETPFLGWKGLGLVLGIDSFCDQDRNSGYVVVLTP